MKPVPVAQNESNLGLSSDIVCMDVLKRDRKGRLIDAVTDTRPFGEIETFRGARAAKLVGLPTEREAPL